MMRTTNWHTELEMSPARADGDAQKERDSVTGREAEPRHREESRR